MVIFEKYSINFEKYLTECVFTIDLEHNGAFTIAKQHAHATNILCKHVGSFLNFFHKKIVMFIHNYQILSYTGYILELYGLICVFHGS